MTLKGYIAYQRREFCKDILCPVQLKLEQRKPGTKEYEDVRNVCKTKCIHSTYEFHHWLINKGYLVVRPASDGPT
ncbi:MAG: hypothetical protein KAT34_10235 [Candidatus Aminicenantes bacterium]|nr:hypothetical protein [Candidatus Aminicenantes bacterium]